MRPTRIAVALAAAAGAAAAWPAAGGALPPGGAADDPGTPAGALEITNPGGLREGKVQFCVRSFLVVAGGAVVPQQFMVKLDDHGSNGIGPFQPDASGTYCGEIATDPAAYATKVDDKLPAGLCSTGTQHWLRVLSGAWAAAGASNRSLAKDFAIDATCASGGKAAPPGAGSVIGTDAGVAAPSSDGTGGGAGTGDGGGPGAGGGAGDSTTPSLSGQARLRSSAVRVVGRTVTLRLRRTGAVGRGTITVRSVSRLRTGRGGERRIRTLVAARPYRLTSATNQTIRVRLTATGQRVLRSRSRLTARLTMSPRGGQATTSRVVLRPARTATTK